MKRVIKTAAFGVIPKCRTGFCSRCHHESRRQSWWAFKVLPERANAAFFAGQRARTAQTTIRYIWHAPFVPAEQQRYRFTCPAMLTASNPYMEPLWDSLNTSAASSAEKDKNINNSTKCWRPRSWLFVRWRPYAGAASAMCFYCGRSANHHLTKWKQLLPRQRKHQNATGGINQDWRPILTLAK